MSARARTLALRASIAALALAPALAAATGGQPLPEPGTWTLVFVGLVAAVALSRRNRK